MAPFVFLTTILTIAALACLVGVVIMRGKRIAFLKLSAMSAFMALLFSFMAADQEAESRGWESSMDEQTARDAGVTDPDTWREMKAAEIRAEAEAEAEKERVARKAGFHCLSQYDGRHRALARAVKESLREPDSFEHVETRITPVNDDKQHTLIMTYRARNGFGGINVEKLFAVISHESCDVISITTN